MRLNIPLLSVVDTDTPSAEIDYPIPANTKSLRFYHTLASMLVRACNEGAALRGQLEHYAVQEEEPPPEESQQPRGRGGKFGGRGGRGGDGGSRTGRGRPRPQARQGARGGGGSGGRRNGGDQGGGGPMPFRAPDSKGRIPRGPAPADTS